MTKEFTPQELLALPLEPNDSGATTVGGYLTTLAHAVWNEGENFSGKRPFGNSGWSADLWKPFIVHEVVDGSLDENGDVESIHDYEFEAQMSRIFGFLTTVDWKTAQECKEPEDWYVVLLDTTEDDEPRLADCFSVGFTEKEAKYKVEARKNSTTSGVWVAVHIPK